MGRETMLAYGKITIVSNGSTLEELEKTLSRVLKKHGYPETESLEYDPGEEEKKLAEMMKKDGAEIRSEDGESGSNDLQDVQEESEGLNLDY